MRTAALIAVLVAVAVANNSAQKETPLRADRAQDNTCDDCQALVGRFIKASQDPFKREELQSALRVACGYTPYANECKVLVKNIERVVLRLEPYMKNHRAVCRKLKLCDAQSEIQAFAKLFMLGAKRHMDMIDGQGSSVCGECQLAANGVAEMISDKSRQQAVQRWVRRMVCGGLRRHKDTCIAAADELLPAFFVDLEAVFADSKTACNKIGFCNNGVAEAKLRHPTVQLGELFERVWSKQPRSQADGLSCFTCEVTFDVILDDMRKPESYTKLGDGLRDGVCPKLPEAYLDGCNDFLSLYAPTVVLMTVDQFDSHGICDAMKKCNVTDIAKFKALSPTQIEGMKCEACRETAKYAAMAFEDPEFTADLIGGLETYACEAFPGTFKPLCENLVERFVPTMVQKTIRALADPEVCARRFHMC